MSSCAGGEIVNKQWGKKSLLLNDTYSLDVRVEYHEGIEVTGLLNITSSEVTLEIHGQIDSKISLPERYKIEMLRCTYNLSKNIQLYKLELIEGKTNYLQNNQTAFTKKYRVQELLYKNGYLHNDTSFQTLEIFSSDIVKWVGNTNKQQALIKNYGNNSKARDKDIKSNEMSIELRDCYLIVGYSATIYCDVLSAGVFLTPKINILMKYESTLNEIKNVYKELMHFFYLLLGYDMDVEHLNFGGHSDDISYFYKQKLDRKNTDNIFISLGKDVRFNQLGRKELSIEIFQEYSNLTQYQKLMFEYYRKYKMYHNNEEKLLGFFRILENIMFYDELIDNRKKEFLKSKNLEPKKNKIRDCSSKIKFTLFYFEISVELKKILKFTSKELCDIVDLRNNIVHLNEYECSETILNTHISYLEFLTTYGLLKLVGYLEEDFVSNIRFYGDKREIVKYEESLT